VEGRQPMAVIIEGGYMAKQIRPTHLEKYNGYSYFYNEMVDVCSARVEKILIRKTH